MKGKWFPAGVLYHLCDISSLNLFARIIRSYEIAQAQQGFGIMLLADTGNADSPTINNPPICSVNLNYDLPSRLDEIIKHSISCTSMRGISHDGNGDEERVKMDHLGILDGKLNGVPLADVPITIELTESPWFEALK